MKTNYYLLLLMLLFVTSVFAQVGIGTTMPDSQLDIRSSNQLTPANTDGILIPKVDAFPLVNPTVAQQSMLVYLTAATTFGGNPKPIGFYYWNNTPPDWIGISSSINGDHDWYEEGTTVAPNAITDDMFHTGNVAIGKNTANTPLDLLGTDIETNFNIQTNNNLSNALNNHGILNSYNGNSTDNVYVLRNTFSGSSSGNVIGNSVQLNASGTNPFFGSYNVIGNTSSGSHIAIQNSLGFSSNNNSGVRNLMQNSTSGGSYTGISNELYNNTTNLATRGVFNQLGNTGDGVVSGIVNSLFDAGGGTQYGINTSISNSGNGTHYGNYNLLTGTGNGINSHYGSYNLLTGTGTTTKYGNYNLINTTAGGTHYGVYSEVLKPGATNFAGYFLGNVGIGTTAANTYTFPPSRGTIGQTLRTDGTGNVTWANNSDFAWSLNGNSALATNFIGTTNVQPFRIFTSNVERMNIAATGNVGINIAPSAYKLDVASVAGDAIFGHSTNVGGVLGYETNFTVGTAGTILGAGVFASNPTAGYTSSFAQSTGAATVAANINFSNVWIASYNLVDNASATFNPPSLYGQLNITNTALGGNQAALRGYSSRGTIAGNPGYTIGVQATSDAQNQDSYAVFGQAFTNSTTRAGGYFESNSYPGVNQAFAYVASTVGLARKITGTNAVSEIVPTESHGRVTLTCPESPEYWYQDYGTVEMINGKAIIILDEILADIIVVNDENPIRVTCTPVAMPFFNGITIMSQTKNSVEIIELNGGNHSGKLQYQLVLRPKTGFGEGRFPQAPGPAYLKADKEPIAAKAKNQPLDGRKIFYWPSDHIVYKYNPEDLVGIGDVIPAGPNAGKIKLANGKYGEGLPPENPQAKR